MADGYVGVAPGTTTFKTPDGQTIALEDWIDDQLYASAQLNDGETSKLEVFGVGKSQTIPGGTRAQTGVDSNIPKSGDNGLPKDWAMLIYGYGFLYSRVTRPGSDGKVTLKDQNGSISTFPITNTIFQIDRVLTNSFIYNGKQYTQGVTQDYPAGHGYWVESDASGFEYASNGVPSPRDRKALVLPVYMRENLGYTWNLQPEAPLSIAQPAPDAGATLTVVDVKVYLYGLIKRTVV